VQNVLGEFMKTKKIRFNILSVLIYFVSPLVIIFTIILVLFSNNKINSTYYGEIFSKTVRAKHTYVVLALDGAMEEFKLNNSDFDQDDLIVGEYMEINCDKEGYCHPIFLHKNKRAEMIIE
jgi:hypothetical protein